MALLRPIRSKLVVSCALVILLAVGVVCRIATVSARDQGFERISRSDSRDSVLAMLGKPDTIAPCGQDLWWNGTYFKNDGRCVESWSYSGGFLSRYEVSFDARGMVVAKYPFVSE